MKAKCTADLIVQTKLACRLQHTERLNLCGNYSSVLLSGLCVLIAREAAVTSRCFSFLLSKKFHFNTRAALKCELSSSRDVCRKFLNIWESSCVGNGLFVWHSCLSRLVISLRIYNYKKIELCNIICVTRHQKIIIIQRLLCLAVLMCLQSAQAQTAVCVFRAATTKETLKQKTAACQHLTNEKCPFNAVLQPAQQGDSSGLY